MRYFLSRESVLKWLEETYVYHTKKDDLYELDKESFEFLKNCRSEDGHEARKNKFIDYCLNEGILTKNRVSPKHTVLAKSPDPSLRYLELQITNRCNLNCRHCYVESNNPAALPLIKGGGGGSTGKISSELPAAQMRSVLREFEEMQGLRVLITGGEPLLHSEIEEINEMLPEFSLRKVLFTNGLLLNRRMLRRLNVDEMQISIDGLEDAHESLRGKGTFRSAIRAIERAKKAGVEVSVATMVHPANLEDFDEMEKLFKGMGVKDWTVDIPCITDRLKKHPEFHISPEQGGKYLWYGFGGGLHAGAQGFACGLHLAAIMADGRVATCTFYADRCVGKVEEGLRECWERIKPVRLDDLACDCKYLESCRGGCRYRAELLGNPLGKDLYRCALYDILNTKKNVDGRSKCSTKGVMA